MNCQSCGMPMATDADHGGGNLANNYCKYCTDASGNLKSKEEVREGMINFHMQSFGKTREEAEKEVDLHMSQMPAWQAPAATTQVPPVSETPAESVVPQAEETPMTSPTDQMPETPETPETPVPASENPVTEVPAEPTADEQPTV